MKMKPIIILDLETDPFEFGKMIYPFLAGIYDGKQMTSYWGEDCIERSIEYLASIQKSHIIYAHNGGRFDFFYYLKHIQKQLRIVNNRIVQAFLGKHELRDSYAIMPFALETYKKTKIDYEKFKANRREKHRAEITSYLYDDCRDLYTLCHAFRDEFGDSLTIGGASLKQLRKFHKFDSGNGEYDARMRQPFFFGGRNQCFQTGIIEGPIQVYDVNSMYPHVMNSFLHPVSTGIHRSKSIDERTCFVKVEGRNYGAFPQRMKDNSLDFTVQHGTFYPSIHEFQAAIETGTFRPTKIIEAFGYTRRESFSEFVTHFYNARAAAKAKDDKIRTIFYKFVLNSAYGKFAQNPENYADWFITEVGEFPESWHECEKSCEEKCRKKWSPSFMCENYIIWEKPLQELNYYNVATGASITGAARSVLLRGIAAANEPYYCDTDSIICRSLEGLKISDTELGAWKLECSGSRLAICGKKLYALYDGNGTGVKKAHKGALLTYEQILEIASGKEVESYNPVPAFKFDGSHRFTSRTIKSTEPKY